jgi:putative membrane protein
MMYDFENGLWRCGLWGWMMIITVVIWIIIIILLVRVRKDDPLKILNEKYASGQIGEEEYQKKKEQLEKK